MNLAKLYFTAIGIGTVHLFGYERNGPEHRYREGFEMTLLSSDGISYARRTKL